MHPSMILLPALMPSLRNATVIKMKWDVGTVLCQMYQFRAETLARTTIIPTSCVFHSKGKFLNKNIVVMGIYVLCVICVTG